MAFDAVAGSYESVLAVVAGAAGFTLVHVAHGCFERAGFEREDLGVAVGAFVHAEVEFVAEVGLAPISLKENVGRLVTFVAFVALAGDSKGVLAIVAGAARLAFLHAGHGRFECACFIGEGFCMAVRAFKHADMNLVAENRISHTFEFEGYFAWLHPFMAVATVAGNSKGFLAIMTGAAGLPFFHLGHGHIVISAGDNLAVMTAAAGKSGFPHMDIVAEGYFRGALHFEGYGSRFAFMAFGALFFVLDAKCLDP